MTRVLLTIAFVLFSAAGVVARCDAAELSIAGGGFITDSPSQAGGAVLLSSAASVPALPIELQATVLVPIVPGGGYAVTGEVRGLSGGGYGGAYVGAGAGVGNLSTTRQTGPVLTAFVGKPLAPFSTLELRLYKGTQTGGSTAGFIGIRFSF